MFSRAFGPDDERAKFFTGANQTAGEPAEQSGLPTINFSLVINFSFAIFFAVMPLFACSHFNFL